MPKNVGDLGKIIVAKALKACPKFNKSPNLVTLIARAVLKQNVASMYGTWITDTGVVLRIRVRIRPLGNFIEHCVTVCIETISNGRDFQLKVFLTWVITNTLN